MPLTNFFLVVKIEKVSNKFDRKSGKRGSVLANFLASNFFLSFYERSEATNWKSPHVMVASNERIHSWRTGIRLKKKVVKELAIRKPDKKDFAPLFAL